MIDTSFREWRAFATTAVVATRDASDLCTAWQIAEMVIDDVDAACSRFRADSELSAFPCDGNRHAVSPLLASIVAVGLRAAKLTDGLVDPTVGHSLIALGYDADFGAVSTRNATTEPTYVAAPGWRSLIFNHDRKTLSIPPGLVLDFGATAKAYAADVIASQALQAGVSGILVNLGGDIAIAGESPEAGWRVSVGDDHRIGDGPCIALRGGGLATSSTTVRRWRQGSADCHHIVDPRTGKSAQTLWRTVSVAAASCVDANIASTAAIVLGDAAPAWLAERNLPSRLVDVDGCAQTQSGWPIQAVATMGA